MTGRKSFPAEAMWLYTECHGACILKGAARLEEAVVSSICWSALRSPADVLVERGSDSIGPGTDALVATPHQIVETEETKSVAVA